MDALLRIGLSNAVVAAVLAVVVLVVSRLVRRPALAHALRLLVLIKLITPPLHSVSLDAYLPAATPEAVGADPVASVAVQQVDAEAADWIEPPDDAAPAMDLAGLPEIEPLDEASQQPAMDQTPAVVPSPAESWRLSELPWMTLIQACWLTGSLAWLLLAAWRMWRFHCLLRHARLGPPSLQQEARRLARQLGLNDSPRVCLVPGRVSPMLWALDGTPRLLLPAELWPTLQDEQRAALLLHELAHWKRGDHWVRLLELVTTGLYWWHPVVWWARRELHEAEEQCCDAWVVWARPHAARAYALALVETLDFLSEAGHTLPATASGAGHISNLRRRMTMIMRGTTPRRLNWGGFLAVLGAGALLLPLLPTWAQDRPQDTPAPGRSREEKRDTGQRDEVERTREELRKLETELKRMHDQIQVVERRLQERRARLAEMEGRRDGDRVKIDRREESRNVIIIVEDPQGRQIRRIEAQPGAEIRLPSGDGPRNRAPEGAGGRPGMGPPGAGPNVPLVEPRTGQLGGPPGAAGAGALRGRLTPPEEPAPGRSGGGGSERDARLERLERRIESILRELEQLRGEMRNRGNASGPGAGPRRESKIEEEEQDVIRRRPDQPSQRGNRRQQPRPAEQPTPAADPKPAEGVPGNVPPAPVVEPLPPATTPPTPGAGQLPPATTPPAPGAVPPPSGAPATPPPPRPANS